MSDAVRGLTYRRPKRSYSSKTRKRHSDECLFHFRLNNGSIDRKIELYLSSYAAGLTIDHRRRKADRASRRDRLLCKAVRQSLYCRDIADPARCQECHAKRNFTLHLVLTSRIRVTWFRRIGNPQWSRRAARRRWSCIIIAVTVAITVPISISAAKA